MKNLFPESDERATPKELFEELDKEFHFELDVCAMPSNAKCADYYHLGNSGLKNEWKKMNFMNPPFSDIGSWLRKAKEEADKGNRTVCILPCDGSTRWFHKYIWDKNTNQFRCQVRFPDRRYSFGPYTNASKFAVLIAILGEA